MGKACLQCHQDFKVTDRDREFYQKMDLPSPTLCPLCRMQRRYTWRNERKLYHRTCGLCKKPMISCFSPDKKLIVYCRPCWNSDRFDPYIYGRDFDFSRPFFEQFSELEKAVPHFALFQDKTSENCDYTNYGLANKSCYMSMCAYCENIYYSELAIMSQNCVNVTRVYGCSECHEDVDCTGCSRLFFSLNCTQCHDSAFLVNCSDCHHCFGSINLQHKQYVFLGEQLSKEDYEKRMAAIRLSPKKIQEMLAYMEELLQKSFHRYYLGANNHYSSGDYLDNTERCYECFDVLNAADCAYCDFSGGTPGNGANDLWDCSNGGVGSIMVYESMGFVAFNQVGFHLYGRQCSNCFYNQYCFNSQHLFGCIGLGRAEYAILNKKYSKADYEKLVPRIIEHMKKTKEWGEFFPARHSPYAYNETLAQDYFPLSQEDVLAQGLQWKEPEAMHAPTKAGENIKFCVRCAKSFLIIEQEKRLYEKFSLPFPEQCPDCRCQRRFRLRHPRKLYDRACAQCQKPIQTTYAPERPEKVVCEACYLKMVY